MENIRRVTLQKNANIPQNITFNINLPQEEVSFDLINSFSLILFIIGIFYLIYLLNKKTHFLNEISSTGLYIKFESFYIFILGYLVKHTVRFIDTEIGKKFTNFIYSVRKTYFSSKKVAKKSTLLNRNKFYLVQGFGIICLIFAFLVLIDLLCFLFAGETVNQKFLKILLNSIENVKKSILEIIFFISSKIYFFIKQIYLGIRHPLK